MFGNQQESKPLTEEELQLRKKPWAELTDAQKIERQRDIIKDLQRSLSFIQSQFFQLQSNFNQHQHSEKGIVVPLIGQGLDGVVSGVAKLANPNYF